MTILTVTIPIWLISLIVPLFVTILIASFSSILKATKQSSKVEAIVDEINKRLDRIENKLDSHILKEAKNE